MKGTDQTLPTPSQPTGDPAPPSPPSSSAFYTQTIDWRSCRDKDQCGTLLVPLDYADPRGETIKLSVLKVPASDQSEAHRVAGRQPRRAGWLRRRLRRQRRHLLR